MPRIVLLGSVKPFTERLAEALQGTSANGVEVFTADSVELSRILSRTQSSAPEERPTVAIYAAAERGEGDLPSLEDARATLLSCADAGFQSLVVIASSAAYEPSHHHPGLACEERMPALRQKGRQSRTASWRAFEAVVAEIAEARPAVALTLLRPPPMPLVDGGDRWSRWLTGPIAGAPLGRDPTLQLMAVSDLAAAAVLATNTATPARAAGSAKGESAETGAVRVFNLAPAASIPLAKALKLAGTQRLPLPSWCLQLGGRSGRDFVHSLNHPWTVSGEKAARELGFVPRFSSAQVALGLRRRGVPRLDRLVTLPAPLGKAIRREQLPGESSKSPALLAEGDQRGAWGPEGEPAPADWDLRFDDFGFDESYVARLEKTLFRFLHDRYWRIEVAGAPHLPNQGKAVLVGIHRGLMPWDGVMALTAVRRATGRTPRFLIHPALNKFPFLSPYMTKLGGIHACNENADRILDADGLLGVFPEGIRGAFSCYKDAYELKKFGRDEFVRMALRNRAPLLPFVTVGSAEIYPILAKLHWRWWKRLTEWPCLPITPTFPLLPVPLPSKWHTRFLAPIHIEKEHGPEAAEDPRVVHEIGERVRSLMKRELEDMRQRRQSIFFGDIFPSEATKKRKGFA
ncbi:MAG: 1-acyl-sn-glycerol-3-phosphate acyltransferase [Deltaproteobacteria bacterium]|nr:1-acyl-sn-glycerol-3-phosphate acyltransferase [Deltaproteobacteria bacterium]